MLTFNIHRGRHDGQVVLGAVAEAIAEADVDVVALQEVRHNGPGIEDQAGWLADRLGWQHAFGANVIRRPLRPGLPQREFGNALLSRHPILGSRNVPLPNRPGLEQRGLLVTRIDVDGTTVTLGNTHLQHKGPWIRARQARAAVSALRPVRTPRLLMGDLNDEPGTPPLRATETVFNDPWTAIGAGPGFTVPVRRPDRRIDFTLADDSFRPIESRLLDTGISDHLPVRTELRLCPAQ